VQSERGVLADKIKLFGDNDRARAAARQEMLQVASLKTEAMSKQFGGAQAQASAQAMVGQLQAEAAKERASTQKMVAPGGPLSGLTPAKLGEDALKIVADSKGAVTPEQARQMVLAAHGQGAGPQGVGSWAAGKGPSAASLPTSAPAPSWAAEHLPGFVASRLDPKGYAEYQRAKDLGTTATAIVHGSTGLRGEAAQKAADQYIPHASDTPEVRARMLAELRARASGGGTPAGQPQGFRALEDEEGDE
jgi:hypothetical protein